MESCWDIAMEWSPETQVKIGQYVASHPYRIKNRDEVEGWVRDKYGHVTKAEFERRSLVSPNEHEIGSHEHSANKLQRKIASRLNRNERILLRLKHKAMRRAGQEVPKTNYYDNNNYTHKDRRATTASNLSTEWRPYSKFEYKDSTVQTPSVPKITRPQLKVMKGGGRTTAASKPMLRVANG